jgi:phage shock protein PspC (stress-responsive transcriptional regulator)
MQSPIQQPSLPPLDPPPESRILDALSRILSLYLFRRANRRKLLGGVCRGMANHLGAPAILLRIAFIAATVLGAAGIWIYLALWFFIPR